MFAIQHKTVNHDLGLVEYLEQLNLKLYRKRFHLWFINKNVTKNILPTACALLNNFSVNSSLISSFGRLFLALDANNPLIMGSMPPSWTILQGAKNALCKGKSRTYDMITYLNCDFYHDYSITSLWNRFKRAIEAL